MSLQSSTATLSPGLSARSGDLFAKELAALAQDIQRTREWFNSQLDAQLARLKQLCAATHVEEPKSKLSMATLFEAPRPVMLAPSAGAAPAPTEAAPAPAPLAPLPLAKAPPVHQAIILPPTLTATLDPQLEQATLHELNNALTRAFSEISARGGMIS